MLRSRRRAPASTTLAGLRGVATYKATSQPTGFTFRAKDIPTATCAVRAVDVDPEGAAGRRGRFYALLPKKIALAHEGRRRGGATRSGSGCQGTAITTWFAGKTPSRLPSTVLPQGIIGFRNGSQEDRELLGHVREELVGRDGLHELFSRHRHRHPCGHVANGSVNIGKANAMPDPVGSDLGLAVRPRPGHAGRQADRLGNALRDRVVAGAHSPVRLQDVRQRPLRRNRPDAVDRHRDPLRRVRRHQRPRQRSVQCDRCAPLHDDRPPVPGQTRRALRRRHRAGLRNLPSWTTLPGLSVYPAAGSMGTQYYTAPEREHRRRPLPVRLLDSVFDDSGWDPAQAQPAYANLEATPTGKVEQNYHAPTSIVQEPNGNYLVDFGRTWAGGVRLNLANPATGVVSIDYGEVLNTAKTGVQYDTSAGNDYEDQLDVRARHARPSNRGASASSATSTSRTPRADHQRLISRRPRSTTPSTRAGRPSRLPTAR